MSLLRTALKGSVWEMGRGEKGEAREMVVLIYCLWGGERGVWLCHNKVH